MQPRPTTYNGIKMRSRLEAHYAQHLDAFGLSWKYEPGTFADQSGQYLPDFLVTDSSGNRVFVEVKPTDDQARGAVERLFGFQRGVTVASSAQFGFPA